MSTSLGCASRAGHKDKRKAQCNLKKDKEGQRGEPEVRDLIGAGVLESAVAGRADEKMQCLQ